MAQALWQRLQDNLQRELDPEEFTTWFRPLKVREESADSLILSAPSERFLHTLEQSYRPAVDRAISELKGSAFRVLFAVETAASPGRQATGGEADGGEAFNPRYTFKTFVVGNSNQFAHAAARSISNRPAESYNPLFLYAGVGLGKTHLLHATGHAIAKKHPGLRVMYLPAEQFVNELISSLRFNRMPEFRERYRSIDVLMVDDIQFLANKERTQEEFFHTFNTLYTRQKQIILSSDSSPRDIRDLEERLRSRFEWGLIADIQPPDLETKVAILRRKADQERVALPDDVALFIASQVKSNIRELEGRLNRVVAFASLTAKPITLELTKETLKDMLADGNRRILASEITKHVARHYGLKVNEIKSKNNSKQIAFPRQVAMYLCKRLTDLSYPEIGKQFNDKHHSTVMYSVEKIEALRAQDPDLDRTIKGWIHHFS
ncbi:MAG: chromosomal replication initiator protein DnaA [Acidobacteriota bacterium]|nr:chromosomal replication initiator protein DnaA [Acidobacteriota bacterium]MDH3522268.1 chromosomal replication initiator protein DnaA [Acidobacteriota bacterium]